MIAEVRRSPSRRSSSTISERALVTRSGWLPCRALPRDRGAQSQSDQGIISRTRNRRKRVQGGVVLVMPLLYGLVADLVAEVSDGWAKRVLEQVNGIDGSAQIGTGAIVDSDAPDPGA